MSDPRFSPYNNYPQGPYYPPQSPSTRSTPSSQSDYSRPDSRQSDYSFPPQVPQWNPDYNMTQPPAPRSHYSPRPPSSLSREYYSKPSSYSSPRSRPGSIRGADDSQHRSPSRNSFRSQRGSRPNSCMESQTDYFGPAQPRPLPPYGNNAAQRLEESARRASHSNHGREEYSVGIYGPYGPIQHTHSMPAVPSLQHPQIGYHESHPQITDMTIYAGDRGSVDFHIKSAGGYSKRDFHSGSPFNVTPRRPNPTSVLPPRPRKHEQFYPSVTGRGSLYESDKIAAADPERGNSAFPLRPGLVKVGSERFRFLGGPKFDPIYAASMGTLSLNELESMTQKDLEECTKDGGNLDGYLQWVKYLVANHTELDTKRLEYEYREADQGDLGSKIGLFGALLSGYCAAKGRPPPACVTKESESKETRSISKERGGLGRAGTWPTVQPTHSKNHGGIIQRPSWPISKYGPAESGEYVEYHCDSDGEGRDDEMGEADAYYSESDDYEME